MRFRIFVIKDPEEKQRGYSLKGIKVPLINFCPVPGKPDLLGYNDKPMYGRYPEFWKVPTSHLISARPNLKNHLKGIDFLLIPTEWCDVHPDFQGVLK